MSTLFALIEDLPTDIPHLKPDGTNWTIFSLRFRMAMQAMQRWEYFDGTRPRPTPNDPSALTNAEIEAQKRWDHADVVARCFLSQRLPNTTFMRISQYQTAQEHWTHVNEEYVTKSVYALNIREQAFLDMHCPKDANVRTYLTGVRHEREELAAAGVQITEKDYQRAVLRGLPEELVTFASQLLSTARFTHHAIDTETLIDPICEEAERLKNHRMRIQEGHGRCNNRQEVKDEAPSAGGSRGGRRRRRGKCHNCGKEGHWARNCRIPKEERTTTAQAARWHASSGVTTQPETNLMGVARSLPITIVNEDGSPEGGEDWEIAW